MHRALRPKSEARFDYYVDTSRQGAYARRVSTQKIAKFTGMKLDIVKEVTLPVFSTEFNVPSFKANLEIAVRHKLAKPFEVETMIFKP